MKLGEWLSRLNRLQNERMFKIIASAVVVLLGIGLAVAYSVNARAPSASVVELPPATAVGADGRPLSPEQRDAMATTARLINSVLAAKQDSTSVVVGCLVGTGLALVVIWIGLGLTYLGLAIAGGLLGVLVWLVPGTRRFAPITLGVLSLTAAFTALMQGSRLLLSASNPIIAVAKNVLAEAVRLKLSLVFIVLLMFGLAALPGLLDDTQPLRYRAQTFLQYSTAGSFWLIAILVLLFSAQTVAFEQRDKVIWQTMTKPVSAAQYLLGKWLGIVTLAAVLLAVSGSGIFLFTEYLRSQPAAGERAGEAYVMADGGSGLSDDRRILETQILTSRVARQADPPRIEPEQFEKNVRDRVEAELKGASEFQSVSGVEMEKERQRIYSKLHDEVYKAVQQQYRSIQPAQWQDYWFSNMREARASDQLITLRYKVNAGSNSPDALYKLTFALRGGDHMVMDVPLGQVLTTQIFSSSIDDEGIVGLRIYNADMEHQPPMANVESISFPPDGLELSYSVGGWRSNFARVMMVLWVKIAFLAMLAITCSTFMSFPVACLVSFGAFLAGETGGFLKDSLNVWSSTDDKDKIVLYKWVVEKVAVSVEWTFRTYTELKPTKKLVDGLHLPWSDVAWGAAVLAFCTLVLFLAGSFIFKRRELATYSGQ